MAKVNKKKRAAKKPPMILEHQYRERVTAATSSLQVMIKAGNQTIETFKVALKQTSLDVQAKAEELPTEIHDAIGVITAAGTSGVEALVNDLTDAIRKVATVPEYFPANDKKLTDWEAEVMFIEGKLVESIEHNVMPYIETLAEAMTEPQKFVDEMKKLKEEEVAQKAETASAEGEANE